MVEPASEAQRVQGYVAAMRVPVITPQQVIVGPCPADPDAAGCTWYTTPAPVYVRPDDIGTPVVFYFEMGRRYWTTMDEGERHRFLTLVNRKRWTAITLAWFADAYSACALGQTPVDPVWHSTGFYSGYGYLQPRHVHREVCGLIRRAAS